MIRTALTLSISAPDAQNCSYLANGTHLGLLSSATQNIHVQTSHRPVQLLVSLRADDDSSGALSRQRQMITSWQSFLPILARYPSGELNNLMQKYHLQPDWLICLTDADARLQAWMPADAGFYLLRGRELRRLRPAAGSENRMEMRTDENERQYYALNVQAADHFFLLPPALLGYFSSGEAAGILMGLRQLPAKMSDLFNTARLRGYHEESTWLALQVLRLENEELPDQDRNRFWQKLWARFLHRPRIDSTTDSGSDSIGMNEPVESSSESAESTKAAARPERRLMVLFGGGLLALLLLILISRWVFWPAVKDPAASTQTVSAQTTGAGSATPTPAPSQTTKPTTTIALPKLTVSARQLNLRELPDRNSKLLVTLKNGDILYKMAEPESDWIKVQTMDGLTGYVFASYVTEAVP